MTNQDYCNHAAFSAGTAGNGLEAASTAGPFDIIVTEQSLVQEQSRIPAVAQSLVHDQSRVVVAASSAKTLRSS